MAETYDITFGASPVGTAQVEKQGLYYAFSCRCQLPDEGIYRIHVLCGEKYEDLGICIPLHGAFGMDKKIAAKNLPGGQMRFHLLPKDWKPEKDAPVKEPEKPMEDEGNETVEAIVPTETVEETFVPVLEDEPFAYLDRLENAVMELREEQVGILLQKGE